jgi:hypothetical protein
MAGTDNRLIFNPDYYSDKDLLGFNSHIDVLSNMICAPEFKTPFCIGIYGRWGTGKTTFMRLLEEAVKACMQDRLGKKKSEAEKYIIPVWFNPWRYAKEEHLIIPFLKTIQQEINTYAEQNKEFLNKIYGKLTEFAKGIDDLADAFAFGVKQEFKFNGLGLTLGMNIDNSKIFERLEDLEARRREEAKTLADRLSSMYYGIVRNLKEQLKQKPFRIIVFIDDLDRCLPQKAVGLLEAVKLFLDLHGYLFVIGVDKEIVKQGIAEYYKHLDQESGEEKSKHTPDDYLDKMIQLPLDLPHIAPDKRKEYIKTLLNNDTYGERADIIDRVIGDNPRSLKRFINLLAFTTNLAENLKQKIKENSKEKEDNQEVIERYFVPLMYVKWSLIVYKFPAVHAEIKRDWTTLGKYQAAAINNTEETKNMDDRLIEMLKKGAKKTAEDFFPENRWLIENFIYLTESTRIQVSPADASAGIIRQYKAGEMALIPKGPFLYGEGNNQIEKKIDHDYYT